MSCYPLAEVDTISDIATTYHLKMGVLWTLYIIFVRGETVTHPGLTASDRKPRRSYATWVDEPAGLLEGTEEWTFHNVARSYVDIASSGPRVIV